MNNEARISILSILREYETILNLIEIDFFNNEEDRLHYKACTVIRATLELLLSNNLMTEQDDIRVTSKMEYLEKNINILYNKYKKMKH